MELNIPATVSVVECHSDTQIYINNTRLHSAHCACSLGPRHVIARPFHDNNWQQSIFIYARNYQVLKPKYSFGKWWKLKISLMGIVHKSCTSSQSPVNIFVRKPSIFLENCIKLTLSGCPREFSNRDMYIAPSRGHTSFNFNMPFKLLLRICEVVF